MPELAPDEINQKGAQLAEEALAQMVRDIQEWERLYRLLLTMKGSLNECSDGPEILNSGEKG